MNKPLLNGNPPEPVDEFEKPIWIIGFKKIFLWIVLGVSSLIFWLLIFYICFLFMGVTTVHAQEIPEQKAVKAIIGEAEGEPYAGKVAVACAIRNRGTLKGVYGLHAPRVVKHLYSHDTYIAALLAWNVSEEDKTCDELIHGASFWEGDTFQRPYWARNMIETAHIGHQIFFKEK